MTITKTDINDNDIYKVFYKELSDNHKNNVLWNIIDAGFFQIFYACYMPSVIIVSFLKHYTRSQLMLNFPMVISSFFLMLGSFAMSFVSSKLKTKKKAVLITGSLQRLSWSLVIASVYFFKNDRKMLIFSFLISLVIFEMLQGCVSIFWQEFIGRVFLPERRGSAIGIRESIGGILGFVMGVAAVYILNNISFPNNYITLFAIGFFAHILSIISIGMIKEPFYCPNIENNNKKPLLHVKDVLRLPVTDRIFGWYVLFALFYSGYMFIGSLYTSVGIERFGTIVGIGKLTGIINAVTLFSGAVFIFIISKIYEKTGKYSAFVIIVICMVVTPLWAMICQNFYGYMIVFILNGIITSIWIIDLNTVLDLSPIEKRHEYIAFNCLIKLFPVILYTNLGGYLTDRVSPFAPFIISSFFCFVGLLILLFKLGLFWKNNTKYLPCISQIKINKIE